MTNDMQFLLSVLAKCRNHSIDAIVFGGWAEEILGAEPWNHSDVDLLIRDNDFGNLDRAIREEGAWHEIVPKRFPHKRAVTMQGVMIEFFLVQEDTEGLFTDFFNRFRYRWPTPLMSAAFHDHSDKLHVAGRLVLDAYRKAHHNVRSACDQYLAEQDAGMDPLPHTVDH